MCLFVHVSLVQSSSPWRLLSTLQDDRESGSSSGSSRSSSEDEEEYFKILGSPDDKGTSGQSNASLPIELEGVLYELEGRTETDMEKQACRYRGVVKAQTKNVYLPK